MRLWWSEGTGLVLCFKKTFEIATSAHWKTPGCLPDAGQTLALPVLWWQTRWWASDWQPIRCSFAQGHTATRPFVVEKLSDLSIRIQRFRRCTWWSILNLKLHVQRVYCEFTCCHSTSHHFRSLNRRTLREDVVPWWVPKRCSTVAWRKEIRISMHFPISLVVPKGNSSHWLEF